MSAVSVRRTLHATNAVVTLALLASGFLIEWPDLRARVVGGYGREIARVHLWLGAAFVAMPALALLVSLRPLVREFRLRLGPPDPLTWRKFHLVVTLAASVLLAGSGMLLWLDEGLPLAVLDASLELHVAMTWTLAMTIPIHLIAARRKIAARTRAILGRGDELPFPFDGDDGLPEQDP